MGSRRVGKEPIIKHPPEVFNISDSSDSVESGLEDDVELNHGVKDFVEDNSDSWVVRMIMMLLNQAKWVLE